MLTDPILIASCALMGVMVLALAALKGWQGWLALKERELDLRVRLPEIEHGSREGAARIEIADLKERVRQLEAIASGVDL